VPARRGGWEGAGAAFTAAAAAGRHARRILNEGTAHG